MDIMLLDITIFAKIEFIAIQRSSAPLLNAIDHAGPRYCAIKGSLRLHEIEIVFSNVKNTFMQEKKITFVLGGAVMEQNKIYDTENHFWFQLGPAEKQLQQTL